MTRLSQAQTSQQIQPSLPISNTAQTPDPLWSAVGQYGVAGVFLLTLGKAYADYRLKVAMEDRAMQAKESAQSLELEGRVFNSLLHQQENSVTSQGQLLNTFIAKTLNQAEADNEKTTSLIATIATLTEAIKLLGDTQRQQTNILYELKEYSEAHTSELSILHEFRTEIIKTLELNVNLTNQILALIERLVQSTPQSNINRLD